MEEFEKNILDFNDEADTNIKIRPNYYIHMAILMAQRTLMFSVVKTTISEGMLAYSVFIEHIEMLCRAAEYITDTYDESVRLFKESEEYTQINRQDVKTAKLANKKLELLMKEVFSRAPQEFKLKH